MEPSSVQRAEAPSQECLRDARQCSASLRGKTLSSPRLRSGHVRVARRSVTYAHIQLCRSLLVTCKHGSVQVGDSLEEFLLGATEDAKLRQLMMSMSEAIRTIAFKVRSLTFALSCNCTNSGGARADQFTRDQHGNTPSKTNIVLSSTQSSWHS